MLVGDLIVNIIQLNSNYNSKLQIKITNQANDLTILFQHKGFLTAVGKASVLPATLEAAGKTLVTHSLLGLPTLRIYSEVLHHI